MTASDFTNGVATSRRTCADAPVDDRNLAWALRLLAKGRSQLVGNTLARVSGTRILSGHFAGMDCGDLVAEGARSARLAGGRVTHADLAIAATTATVVICDIEGAETALPDPVAAPGLRQARIPVECHDCITPGIRAALSKRFAGAHPVKRVGRALQAKTLPPSMEQLSDLDRLPALLAWRTGPTPWLWMIPK